MQLTTPNRPSVALVAATMLVVVASLCVGALVVRAPIAAFGLVAAVAAAAAVLRAGKVVVAQITLASLPWLVIFDQLIPSLLRTFVTAAAAAAVVALVSPLRYRRAAGPVAAALFGVSVLAHAVFATMSDQYIQAAKYVIFPTLVVAVVSERATIELPRVRTAVFGSAAAAMVVHLALVGAGLGSTGTYYGIGEKLGFAPSIPQELSLLSAIVAAAGLVIAKRLPAQIALFGLGALPAVLTGVRAALVSVVLLLLIHIVRNGLSPRGVAVVAGVIALMAAGGGLDTITARFHREAASFSSVGTAGSGRGEIYTAALNYFEKSGPVAWAGGTGLRSIIAAELREIGVPLVGHTDLLEVGVQFGIFTLLVWLVMWAALFRSGLRTMLLVPIAVFSVVNGTMEYVAPLTLALVLAAACVEPPGVAAPAAAPWRRGSRA